MLEEIERSCGHTEEIEVVVERGRSREGKIKWLESGVCLDCYKLSKQKEREAAALRAAEAAREAGLPTLIGSPKQIAWAETLRATALRELAALEASAQAAVAAGKAVNPAQLAALASMGAEWRSEASAKVWIDRRDVEIRDVLRTHMRAL